MNTLQILIGARKLIEKPEGWTTGHFARNAQGEPTLIFSEDASCFCIMGALHRAANRPINEETPCYPEMADVCGGHMSSYNDMHTHAEVLAAFDRAIARASTESESHE